MLRWWLRQLDDAERLLRHAVRVQPDLITAHDLLFYFYLYALGDTIRANEVKRDFASMGQLPEPEWWGADLAYFRRDFHQALELALPAGRRVVWHIVPLQLAVLHRLAGDTVSYRAFSDSLSALADDPDYTWSPSMVRVLLGLAHALRGEADDAIAEVVRGVEATRYPDPAMGGRWSAYLARTYVLVDRPAEAIAELDRLLSVPAGGGVTVASLRAEPFWDPLRDHPRFQALLERYSQPN